MTALSFDVGRLRRWLSAELGDDEPLEVRLMEGGASNEVHQVLRGGDRWVLRRPPATRAHASAHDVLREYRFISALEGTRARVPRPVLACADPAVIGTPFYLMEHVEGVPIRHSIPEAYRGRSEHHPTIGEELIDALAEIHSVDYRTVGLDDMGKPEGFLERQPSRWKKQLDQYRVRELPYVDALAAYLAEHVPESQPPTIVHGDYKTDNVLYTRGLPPRLLAVLDWELATIGDPLLDLAWALFFWPEASDPALESTLGHPGALDGLSLRSLPSREALAHRYALKTRRNVEQLAYYTVLAGYKLAVILEGNYARFLKGLSTSPLHARFETMVPEILRRAHDACAH
jgi:aminoglycoside phosphotransferase (APT) family kinase protein